MLPKKKRRRNADKGRTAPIGTRNLSPREHVVTLLDGDDAGGDFYLDEDAWPRQNVVPADEDDEDPAELAAALARARTKREQARRSDAERRAGEAPAAGREGEGVADGEPGTTQTCEVIPAADAGGVVGEPPPGSAEEVRRRAKRDGRVWKRLGEAGRGRVRQVTHPDALASLTCHHVLCVGVRLRLVVEQAYANHEGVYDAPLTEEVEDREARLQRLRAVLRSAKHNVAVYDGWVAGNRPELADAGLVELLAGSKEDRAAVKARLAALDKTYGLARSPAGTGAKVEAESQPAVPLPVIYRTEYQGKVRAYPEWVARVLRQVARKQAHHIPAMALVLAQLAYWMKPADETGRPRAHRAKLIGGRWWAVLGYGEVERQTPVSVGQARQVVRLLKKLRVVETTTPAAAGVGSDAGGVDYGPNTVFLRLNTEVLDPLVAGVMSR